MRQAAVFLHNSRVGILTEDSKGYSFVYDEEYLLRPDAKAVSLTLPLSHKTYKSSYMIPFFDGLIPEGWLLDIAERNWKVDSRDRMGLLLACCKDCIGAVSIHSLKEEDSHE